jgi:hypothetical protein
MFRVGKSRPIGSQRAVASAISTTDRTWTPPSASMIYPPLGHSLTGELPNGTLSMTPAARGWAANCKSEGRRPDGTGAVPAPSSAIVDPAARRILTCMKQLNALPYREGKQKWENAAWCTQQGPPRTHSPVSIHRLGARLSSIPSARAPQHSRGGNQFAVLWDRQLPYCFIREVVYSRQNGDDTQSQLTPGLAKNTIRCRS